MKIEYKKTKDLIPYEKNSRVHSDLQISQIAASINEFGFRLPILVDGNNIIAGHGRVKAAEQLGLNEVPTVDGSDLTDIQKKQYIIADNRIPLNASWDEEILKLEIEELKNLGADIDILAFDASELQVKEIDYSILDDHNIESQLDDMAKGVRKAIQIEFEPEHYQEATEIVKFWRDQGAYVGYMLLDYLRQEKNKL